MSAADRARPTDDRLEIEGKLDGGRAFELEAALAATETVVLELRCDGAPLRTGLAWPQARATRR